MLKWAVTPRLNGEVFEHDGIHHSDNHDLLTLQSLIEQQQLPCLVRLINDDVNDPIDNYCLLLCQTNAPYLIVSNETERFSIPISSDGLFAPVERGITRYNILQSVRSLQSYFKSASPSSFSSFEFTHFTTLQAYIASTNSIPRRIRPGTLLEPHRRALISAPSPSLSSSSMTSNRLRTLFANLPHSLNKHLSPLHPPSRVLKHPISSNDYFEVKCDQYDENFTLRSDSVGIFVPVHTHLPSLKSHYRSPSSSTSQIQGLYTVSALSKLKDQYPLITELIVSRTLEDNVAGTVGYPCRRVTLHRLVENHSRIIAFDMKNYTFLEIDPVNSNDIYAIEHKNTLFQRYQAQLRWCHEHLASFRSQIKTISHSSNGTPMFIQATPFHGQQLQQYHQRRNSSSIVSSPLTKHIPQTIFTPQESLVTHRLRSHTPLLSKFYTTSNHSKSNQQHLHQGKTSTSNVTARKDVRVYFNDLDTRKHLQDKQTSLYKKPLNSRTNSTDSDSTDRDEENDSSFQCTAL